MSRLTAWVMVLGLSATVGCSDGGETQQLASGSGSAALAAESGLVAQQDVDGAASVQDPISWTIGRLNQAACRVS
jgi:hypothetical protein